MAASTRVEATPAGLEEDASAELPVVRWSVRSLAVVFSAWLVLQLGGIFSPGLLDDVDSIYIEIAREMLHRRDFVTPYVNGIRFFDKPPLMYWMATGSMALFGETDWAARLPLAFAVLALLISVYALGLRLYAGCSPASSPDRGGLYAALATATAIGPYLYTRFFIPDIMIALWMTLSVHLFLLSLDRAAAGRSTLFPALGFAAVLALNVLTKGLIGIVFPIAFVALYLLVTRQQRLLVKLHLLSGTAVFLALAAPWHVLAALRNPAIALPPSIGLPPRAGWAWFYLYNEHVARFLGTRVPHDYGQTPVWLFWLYLILWTMPWATFLPGALAAARRQLGHRFAVRARDRETALAMVLWAAIVMVFFTFSSRQEYYSLPAIPALCLLAGGLLARAESLGSLEPGAFDEGAAARRNTLVWHRWLLLPLSLLIAVVCGCFAVTAPRPAKGADLSSLLANNPELYNLSLGHLFDLTGAAMGLFRQPLVAVALGMLVVGPASYLLRGRRLGYAANLTLAGGMMLVLLAAHEGLARFNPILGSKDLALSIVKEQAGVPLAKTNADGFIPSPDVIVLDGEYTAGSTLVFYTREPVRLINGRVNTLWFGSFWPDAPHVFLGEQGEPTLEQLWAGPRRIFLMTYTAAARSTELAPVHPVRVVAAAGGKTVLSNR